jgi:ABC-type transport system involved in cytochrome c biogenesis ATPase subunit
MKIVLDFPELGPNVPGYAPSMIHVELRRPAGRLVRRLSAALSARGAIPRHAASADAAAVAWLVDQVLATIDRPSEADQQPLRE